MEIDVEAVKNSIVQFMVFVKQSKELLPPLENKIQELESKKKSLEEQAKKEEGKNQIQATENIQPAQTVINPELEKIKGELETLNQKRARILIEIQEAEMEIEKAKASLTKRENPNIKAEELLSNLKGFAEKTDNLITGKKEVSQADLAEELKKLKEKKGP